MKKIVVVLGCALLLSGCTESNIVSPTQSAVQPSDLAPDLNVYSRGIEIDWDEVALTWNEGYADQSMYPIAHSLEYTRDDDAETLEIRIYVQPGTSKEDAAAYATEAIKGLNDSVYTQDFSFEPSRSDYYGSFVSIYNVNVIVAPYDTKDDESTWLLNETIEASEYRDLSDEAIGIELGDDDEEETEETE